MSYRGRHRKPSHTGRNAALISASGAFALPFVAPGVAEAGPPGGWGPIISCESGGRASATNGSSTASGLFQFLDSTWQSVGGSGRAKDAPVSEQYARAERLYAQQGTSPWNASKSCWAGKSGTTPRITGGTAPRSAATPRAAAAPRAVESTKAKPRGKAQSKPRATTRRAAPLSAAAARPGVRWANAPADLHRRDHRGHGTYTCDTDHLGYQACDVATLGQVVAYPAFDRH